MLLAVNPPLNVARPVCADVLLNVTPEDAKMLLAVRPPEKDALEVKVAPEVT